ncbi:MAG: zinc ABC transporter substrate-binding protein [Nitrospirae bacterium]|nr:zinc ABC transporter substrate-binding protein [Nitrospirota bacterium]
MKNTRAANILLCLLLLLVMTACRKEPGGKAAAPGGRLLVVTSLFPVYDFTKNVAGEKADVRLLIPPGMEPHSFEPRPGDVITINGADLLLYTNPFMEPWIDSLLSGLNNPKLTAVNTGGKVDLFDIEHHGDDGRQAKADVHGSPGRDPHIWLDFRNAVRMVENIRDALTSKDPASSDYYGNNARDYIERLGQLDRKYSEAIAGCRKRVIISGGHGTFGYLARRYNLEYITAYGLSPDSEPSPGSLAKVIAALNKNGLKHLFFDELVIPRVSETLAKDTGAGLLMLHGAHNISKDEFERGVTFMSIMENNLENIMTGLQCRQR